MGEAEDRAARAARARNLLRRAQEKRQQQQQLASAADIRGGALSNQVEPGASSIEHRISPEKTAHESLDSNTRGTLQDEIIDRRMDSLQEGVLERIQRMHEEFNSRLAALVHDHANERQALQDRVAELGAEQMRLKGQVDALQIELESLTTKRPSAATQHETSVHAEILQGIAEQSVEKPMTGDEPHFGQQGGSWAVSQPVDALQDYTSRYAPLPSSSQDYASRYAPSASTAKGQDHKQINGDPADPYHNLVSSATTNSYHSVKREEKICQEKHTEPEASMPDAFAEEDVFKASDNDAFIFSGEDEMAPIQEEEVVMVQADVVPPATESKRESLANDVGELFGSSSNFAEDDPFGKIVRTDSHDFSAAFGAAAPPAGSSSIFRSQPEVKVEENDTGGVAGLFDQPKEPVKSPLMKSPTVSTYGAQKTLNIAPLASPFSPIPGPRDSGARDLLSPNGLGYTDVDDAFTNKRTAEASEDNATTASNEDVSNLFRNSTSDFFGSSKSSQQSRPAIVPPPPRTPQRGGLPMMSLTAPAPVQEDRQAESQMKPSIGSDIGADTSTDAPDASILFGASPPKPIVGGGGRSRGGHHRRAITNANLDFLSSPMRPGVSYGGQAAASNASDDGTDPHAVPAARKAQLLKMGKAAAQARKPAASSDGGTEMSAASLFGG